MYYCVSRTCLFAVCEIQNTNLAYLMPDDSEKLYLFMSQFNNKGKGYTKNTILPKQLFFSRDF